VFAFTKPTYRPFGAGAFLNRYLGLKPPAKSFCPFGAIATAAYVDGPTACGVKLTAKSSHAVS
jgi:hypothetical protein